MNTIDKAALLLTDKLCDYIELKNITKRQELNYYIKRLIKNIIFLSVVLVIAMKLETLPQTILVFLTNLLLRGRLGGLHFDNYILCLMSSIVLLLITGVVAKYVMLNLLLIFLIYILMYLTIMKKGVIDHVNRPIKKEKKIRLKQISLVILTMLLVINMLSFFHNTLLSNSLTYGVFISLIGLLMA